jgi:hypothetical protein
MFTHMCYLLWSRRLHPGEYKLQYISHDQKMDAGT